MNHEQIAMKMGRKNLGISAAAFACALAACALLDLSFLRGKTANASPVPELLSALPPGAPTLVYVDLAAVRASSFYQHRPDRGPIALPSPDYAEFVRSTGFDFERDLDRVAIASWPPPNGKTQRQNVMIAEGRFDRAKIRSYAQRTGTLDHQQGHEIFLFKGDDGAGPTSVSFLDDHHLAIATGSSIAPLFSPQGDDPASDPARQRAIRLDGAAAFAITQVPPIPDNLPPGTQVTQFADLVRSLKWITLAARPEGDALRVSLEGECGNGEDARRLQSTLEALRTIGRAALGAPKTRQSMDPATYAVVDKLLQTADVTQSGERVRVFLELTPDVLKLGVNQNKQ